MISVGWEFITTSLWSLLVLMIVISVIVWHDFATRSVRHPSTSDAIEDLVLPIVQAVMVTGFVVFLRVKDRRFVFLTALQLFNLFSGVIAGFATLYWNYGTPANLDTHLSKIEALYYSVGTFTTAGTGNITAYSDTAKRLQMSQEIVDFLMIGIGLTVILSTLLTRVSSE